MDRATHGETGQQDKETVSVNTFETTESQKERKALSDMKWAQDFETTESQEERRALHLASDPIQSNEDKQARTSRNISFHMQFNAHATRNPEQYPHASFN